MADYKQTVTKSQQDGVTDNGSEVVSQTKKVHTEASVDGRVMVSNAVWFLVGVMEVILGLRFIFKLMGASSAAGFTQFLYSLSGVLTAPFDNIFGVTSTTSGQVRSVFEPSILVAMLIYALIGWGIVALINLDRSEPTA